MHLEGAIVSEDISVELVDERATRDGDLRTYRLSKSPELFHDAIKRSIEAIEDVKKCAIHGRMLQVLIRANKTPPTIDSLIESTVRQAFKPKR